MKKILFVFCILLGSMSLVFANGQGESNDSTWAKKVEIQVPARAGGGSDVIARTLGTEVAKASGRTFTIVNDTDGNGVVAFEKTRTAKTDGSTLLAYHTSMLIKMATNVYNHSLDDFTVIGVAHPLDQAPEVFVVGADSPYQSLDDFVKAAKAAPDTLLVGVETGGVSHIIGGLFDNAAGITLKFVEAGSDTEKLTSLVGKNIDACIVNVNQAKQYVQSNKVRALGVISRDSEGGKSEVLPDVPSFIQQGYNVDFCIFDLLLGPKDMNLDLVASIYNYYANAATSDAVNAVLEPAGFAMEFYGQEKGLQVIEKQQKELNEIVKDLGLMKK
ncbi:MAG: tripartite tricarboxylate transporter substrate binding protein [Spirochaetia bacterium]|jgi:putative tricarboxylic transport membrane protein|nr:tripartite tricarboxylate transporter substrate binding protein [Spirochaetia bacterium]